MISGEADLYINKGQETLPTTHKYWKKSAKYKGDMIEITPDMFDNRIEILGSYSIGVYCREYSKYEITYAPDFGKVYEVKF